MSAVDIYTDLILRTAQFSGPLKAADSELKRVVRQWSNVEVGIRTNFTLPDTAPLRQLINGLRAERVDIPVRFVPQGGMPSMAGQPSGGLAGSTASVVGGSFVAANGRSNLAVSNAASSTLAQAGLSHAVQQFGTHVAAFGQYLASLPAGGGGGGSGGGNGGAPGGGGSGGASGRGTYARQQQAAHLNQQRSAARRAALNSPANNNGGFNNLGSGPGGGLNRQGRRALAHAQRRAAVRRGGGGHGTGGGGGGGGGGGHGAGSGRPGGGMFANIRQGLRQHPSLGQYLSSFGAMYAAEAAINTVVRVGDAGYGQGANARTAAKEKAYQDSIRSIPFLGGLAGGVVDLGTSVGNWWNGDGFVSTRAKTEHVEKLAAAQRRVSRENLDSGAATFAANTYDQKDLIEHKRRTDIARLDADLDEDDDLHEDATDEHGNIKRVLNAAGKSRRSQEAKRIEAEAARGQRDYDRVQGVADSDARVDRVTAGREAGSSARRAAGTYDRDAEIADANAAIDEQRSKRFNHISGITDPREKQRALETYNAESEAVEQQKLAQTAELKRKFAAEDIETTGRTAAANAESVGDRYKAEVEAAEASWQARLSLEQDGHRKELLLEEKAAEEKARLFRRNEESRQFGLAADASQARYEGRHYEQAKVDADEAAKLKDIALTDKHDDGTRTWRSRESMSEDEQFRYDNITRARDYNIGMIDRAHKDEIRRNDVEGRQSQLRVEGRTQMANLVGQKDALGERVRDTLGDPDLLRSLLGKEKNLLDERMIGSQRSEQFGSIAEYATRNWQASAQNDQGAQAENRKLAGDIAELLRTPAAELSAAAQAFATAFGVMR